MMTQTIASPGFTFAVDSVVPATTPKREGRMFEMLKERFDGIESCSDYHATILGKTWYQPLLFAVHTAFSEHRPLVLSPDAIWITIAQGVAQHMTIHGERLRSRFVSHQGKLDLEVRCQGWIEGSPENPWAEAFAGWADLIRQHVGDTLHNALVCDFSTTGPVERAVSQIVMMDVFEHYFHYVDVCVCGIPTITLEGTSADWRRLASKVAALRVFDLDWWLDHLQPICQQFVRASNGDVDLPHWQSICKVRSAYGGDVINGWIARLFPYVRAWMYGPCNRRNPIFESEKGIQTTHAPSGLSRVPFTWRNLRSRTERPMEVIGGIVGVGQDRQSLALRPLVGWAVRPAYPVEPLLRRLTKDHTTFPGYRDDVDTMSFYPYDLASFYFHSNGAELFKNDPRYCRIAPVQEVQPLDWGERLNKGGLRGPSDRTWHRLATCADGNWLAVNLDQARKDPRSQQPGKYSSDPLFMPICQCRAETVGQAGKNPVVALSFTEWLANVLDGKPLADYGDAELFTRR